jgi:hypothetical protein
MRVWAEARTCKPGGVPMDPGSGVAQKAWKALALQQEGQLRMTPKPVPKGCGPGDASGTPEVELDGRAGAGFMSTDAGFAVPAWVGVCSDGTPGESCVQFLLLACRRRCAFD